MKILKKVEDAVDGSAKILFQLSNRSQVESVYLPDPDFYGICVSTQAGCSIGCHFCATAKQRNEYNLRSSEILEQVILTTESVRSALRFDFVTLAGMGEPLANYDNSVRALDDIKEKYKSLSVVSLSTVGIREKIELLNAQNKQYRLYFSMHAATDAKRRKLIPFAKNYTLQELLLPLEKYASRNGDGSVRVSYLLLKDINDSAEDLRLVVELLRGRPFWVQILLWNPIVGLPFERVSDDAAIRWEEELRESGIQAYVMRSKGRTIAAGCGQLLPSESH